MEYNIKEHLKQPHFISSDSPNKEPYDPDKEEKEDTMETTTLADPRRWELKKLIHNMIDEDFNKWYEEIMSWKLGERVQTAQEFIGEVKRK